MSQVSAVLRKTTTGYAWWCPGCKHGHAINVGGAEGPQWSFDGNLERPTFGPSVRIFTHAKPAEDDWPAMPEQTWCHFFIKKGQIDFLNDCHHELAGRVVPMTELSTIEGYGWGDGDA